MKEAYVIAIDQSTSASKTFLIDQNGWIVRRFSKKHQAFYPHPGWVEHDMEEVWQNVRCGIIAVADGVPKESIRAVAISNQRETVVLWNRETGEPVCRAVVWQDTRAQELCRRYDRYSGMVQQKTGLQLSPYYSAEKAAYVLEQRREIQRMAQEEQLCIGTVDSYLVFRLTGGRSCRTDVSNASRTQLMNLQKLQWDDELTQIFGIPEACLPEITLSDEVFGNVQLPGFPEIPITGVMGDSHAALFGQGCIQSGMAKSTYGTGNSVMLNVGFEAAAPQNGLASSVAFGFQGRVSYVLEGNVISSGDTLCWLKDEMGLLREGEDIESIARLAGSTGGVYLVPAFCGLGAPYFDETARAMICGISRDTTRGQIIRAAVESIAYQAADVLERMGSEMGHTPTELRVDGGPTCNSMLMQLQADLTGCPVRCNSQSELSALGAGYMAGIKTGVYTDIKAIPAMEKGGTIYQPTMSQQERENCMAQWRAAVTRCR